jgi:hypothetical protein
MRKSIVNSVGALFLGAYVWVHGNDVFALGGDIRSGHYAHLKPAFAIVAIAYACYIAGDELPKSVKIFLTLLAPFVAIGMKLAIE